VVITIHRKINHTEDPVIERFRKKEKEKHPQRQPKKSWAREGAEQAYETYRIPIARNNRKKKTMKKGL